MTNLTDTTNDQLQALKDFANAESKQLVDELEEILDDVAKTGQYIYPWHFMKPLYACKLDQVTSEFLSTSPPLNTDGTEDEQGIKNLQDFRVKLLQMFDKFVSAPFTIQRVSEMLTEPRKHYKSTAKFFRGLEKNILVVSTMEPVPSDQRPVLKRSRHDENPLDKQNGYVDTALKPQLKKIHLEEENPTVESEELITEEESAMGSSTTTTDENIAEVEGDEKQQDEHVDVVVEDNPATTTMTATTLPTNSVEGEGGGCREENIDTCSSTVPDSSGTTDDGLESMLVCTESVPPSSDAVPCASQGEESISVVESKETTSQVKNEVVGEQEDTEKPIDES